MEHIEALQPAPAEQQNYHRQHGEESHKCCIVLFVHRLSCGLLNSRIGGWFFYSTVRFRFLGSGLLSYGSIYCPTVRIIVLRTWVLLLSRGRIVSCTDYLTSKRLPVFLPTRTCRHASAILDLRFWSKWTIGG